MTTPPPPSPSPPPPPSPSPPPSPDALDAHRPTRSWLSYLTLRARSLLWACWAGVIAMYVLAYLVPTDLFASGRIEMALAFFTFMLRTFVLHAAIGMGFLALCALVVRGRRLALVAAATALIMALPWLGLVLRATPAPDPSRATLTVVVANVNLSNPDLSALFRLIESENADLVLLQEVTNNHRDQLRSALEQRYPHISTAFRQDAFGQALYSKLPFEGAPDVFPQIETMREKAFGGASALSDPQIRVRVTFDGVPIVVQNLHLMPPGDAQMLREQRLQFAWLDQWVRSVKTSPDAPALFLAGDLNSTATSPQHGFLRAAGLREAHDEAGSGLGNTWPDVGLLAKVPGIRIDHAYACNRLTIVSWRVGPHIGSDHRPLVVKLQTSRVQ
ncbi:MAG: endonuclease/exonuclease/phosphatase family protein [Phycisphaerales bacterium]|nr:endonuclease/exonuclease/phosphatase family protein [Phycisphaerales bacterium]